MHQFVGEHEAQFFGLELACERFVDPDRAIGAHRHRADDVFVFDLAEAHFGARDSEEWMEPAEADSGFAADGGDGIGHKNIR
ncbi:hypothetical protein LCGC14_0038680, partial [marine sediment metagenome]